MNYCKCVWLTTPILTTLRRMSATTGKILGYTKAELVGRGFHEFWVQPDPGAFHRALERLKRDGISRNMMRLVSKDGAEIDVMLEGCI